MSTETAEVPAKRLDAARPSLI